MKMTLYRMMASDNFSIVQAQYALNSHQEEVRKEPWFLQFVMNKLFYEMKPRVDLLKEYDNSGEIVWQGWTEVWKYAGEMDWDDYPSDHLIHYRNCNCLADTHLCCRPECRCHDEA